MAVSKVESKSLDNLLKSLSGIVDLNEDLPRNVFVENGFSYWFFERPLLCFSELLAGLISESISSFKSNVFIKFSGGEVLENSCFSISGGNVDADVEWLDKRFANFFDGAVGYPIVIFDAGCRWAAFESAYEEFGVIGVKDAKPGEGVYEFLNSNFISMNELTNLASDFSAVGKTAKVLASTYVSPNIDHT